MIKSMKLLYYEGNNERDYFDVNVRADEWTGDKVFHVCIWKNQLLDYQKVSGETNVKNALKLIVKERINVQFNAELVTAPTAKEELRGEQLRAKFTTIDL